MPPAFIRAAYAIEFLVGVAAVFTAWSQVGGQYHLDLMPWYWKLVCPAALAASLVMATASSVSEEKPWNRRSAGWLAAAFAVFLFMGWLTYYIHTTEPPEEDSDIMTSASPAPPALEPPCRT
jgi:hypothetical protein